MEVSLDTPQRVAIVIEKTKSDTWCIGSYLVTADGRRDWRSLGVFETYAEAAKALRKVWQKATL